MEKAFNSAWKVVGNTVSFLFPDICMSCNYPMGSKRDPSILQTTFCNFQCYSNFVRQTQRQDPWKCLLPGCERYRAQKSYTEHYDYCGRTHARLHTDQLHQMFYEKQHIKTSGSYLRNKTGPILFYSKDDPYYEFTNFALIPIIVDECLYTTSEHYFQAQKLVGTPYESYVAKLPRPRDAFEFPRQAHIAPWVRKDWNEIKEKVMYKGLCHKFGQHQNLKELLLETGDRKLVEDSPHDSYWGIGRDGNGMNRLGVLLMRVRSAMRGKPYDDGTSKKRISTDGKKRDRSPESPRVTREHHSHQQNHGSPGSNSSNQENQNNSPQNNSESGQMTGSSSYTDTSVDGNSNTTNNDDQLKDQTQDNDRNDLSDKSDPKPDPLQTPVAPSTTSTTDNTTTGESQHDNIPVNKSIEQTGQTLSPHHSESINSSEQNNNSTPPPPNSNQTHGTNNGSTINISEQNDNSTPPNSNQTHGTNNGSTINISERNDNSTPPNSNQTHGTNNGSTINISEQNNNSTPPPNSNQTHGTDNGSIISSEQNDGNTRVSNNNGGSTTCPQPNNGNVIPPSADNNPTLVTETEPTDAGSENMEIDITSNPEDDRMEQ